MSHIKTDLRMRTETPKSVLLHTVLQLRSQGFYHDQEQTPEHASPSGGSYPAYRVDGQCIEQCDCGKVNPCAEYIFDVSGLQLHLRSNFEVCINP